MSRVEPSVAFSRTPSNPLAGARRDPEPFDWFQRYSGIKELVGQYLKKADKILNVGAGNSRLTAQMYEDGEKGDWDASRILCQRQMRMEGAGRCWRLAGGPADQPAGWRHNRISRLPIAASSLHRVPHD